MMALRFGRICLPILAVGVAGLSSSCSKSQDTPENPSGSGKLPEFVSVGTAPVGGAFYNIGAAISDVLNQNKAEGGWRQATAESTGGSLENFRRLDAGDIQFGMANSSITYFAVRGQGGFEKAYELRSVMNLFPLVAMFVTRADSGVKTIQDLKGKRVVVGPEGAGFEYFVRPIVEEHGLTLQDFDVVYAGMQTSVGYLQDGSVAATFLGGGLRSPAITSAASTAEIFLVPYRPEARQTLIRKYPSFNAVTVPAGTYRGQTEAYDGLNVGDAHLLVRADADEELVYRAAKIIYENRAKLAETHALAKSITAENVARYAGTEFHPGAVRYFKEQGIWKEPAAAGAEGSGAGN